jgi:hypothetical protein
MMGITSERSDRMLEPNARQRYGGEDNASRLVAYR